MTTQTKPTITSKIRHALRELTRGPEGQFTFDREIRTYNDKYIR
jgi:hypothetical protein